MRDRLVAQLVRISADLAGLDLLSVDAVVMPMFQARMQPLGVAGLIDWRLCGRLGRMLVSGAFVGAAGESVLMGALERIGAERLFLFGLGSATSWQDAPHADDVAPMLRMITEAGAETVALAPPVGPGGTPTASAVMKVWRSACESSAMPVIQILDADGSLSFL